MRFFLCLLGLFGSLSAFASGGIGPSLERVNTLRGRLYNHTASLQERVEFFATLHTYPELITRDEVDRLSSDDVLDFIVEVLEAAEQTRALSTIGVTVYLPKTIDTVGRPYFPKNYYLIWNLHDKLTGYNTDSASLAISDRLISYHLMRIILRSRRVESITKLNASGALLREPMYLGLSKLVFEDSLFGRILRDSPETYRMAAAHATKENVKANPEDAFFPALILANLDKTVLTPPPVVQRFLDEAKTALPKLFDWAVPHAASHPAFRNTLLHFDILKPNELEMSMSPPEIVHWYKEQKQTLIQRAIRSLCGKLLLKGQTQ